MKNKVRENLVNEFISSLEENVIPWEKDWLSGASFNPVTNTKYNGVNALVLMYACSNNGWSDPRFCTFNQAKNKGWTIKKGSTGTKIEFFTPYDTKNKKKIDFTEVSRLKNRLSEEEFKDRVSFLTRFYTVFNASQIEGIPPYQKEKIDWNKENVIELRDTLFKNMGINFHEEGNKAFYSPSSDSITLPPIEMFKSEYGYLSTMLHESGHATGSKSRLDRNLSGVFGSSDYAREELRAEISSAFTSQEIGISSNNLEYTDNHKAYIQNWISVLKDDPQELFKAIKDAEVISDYLLEKSEYKKFIKVHSPIDDLDIFDDKKNYFKENQDVINQIGEIEENISLVLKDEDKYTLKKDGKFTPTQKLVNEVNNNSLDSILEIYQNWQSQLEKQDDIWFVIDNNSKQYYCNVFERTDGDWELQVFNKDGRELDGAVCTEQELRIDKACITLVEMTNHTSMNLNHINEIEEPNFEEKQEMIQEEIKNVNRLSKEIDEIIELKDNRYDNSIKLCETPKVLINIGLKQLPMLYSKKHLRSALKKFNEYKHHHGLSKMDILSIPKLLSEPCIIFKSFTDKNTLVALTDRLNDKKEPLVIVIKPNGQGSYNLELLKSNYVLSIYGKARINNLVDRIIKEKKILFLDKKKSEELFSVLRLQLPEGFNNLRSIDNIPLNTEKVNDLENNIITPEEREAEFQKARENLDIADENVDKAIVSINNSKKELVSEVVKGEVIEENTIENDKRFNMYNEKDFINDKNKFAIYQLKDNVPKDLAFETLERINKKGFDVDRANYDLVYIGDYNPDISLEGLFERFNINRPIDFKGHSLSVSDIIVVNDGVNISAHYCDDIGFKNINDFLQKSKFNDAIIIEDNAEITDLDDEKSIALMSDTHVSEEVRRERLRASHDASYQHQELGDKKIIEEQENQIKQIS